MRASDASSGRDINAARPPFDIGGVLPVVAPGDPDYTRQQPPATNAATGASAASARALISQTVAFYFRAPVKAFFRTRVDYLAYARSIQEQHREAARAAAAQAAAAAARAVPASPGSPAPPRTAAGDLLRWLRARARSTTPGLLASAVRHHGWRVVPEQVLPPLIANVGVGAVLYTTYLHVLGWLHAESGRAARRAHPPPGPGETLAAGFLAGSLQSVLAAPLDAVQARYDLSGGGGAAGMAGSGNPAAPDGGGRARNMWAFSYDKLREIGVRGIFAGWGLSFLKDSLGSAVFFSTFEYLKAQGFYRFVTWYYGSLSEDTVVLLSKKRPAAAGRDGAGGGGAHMPTVIKPHYAIEPAFLLVAGVGASVAQQAILHPLSHVQVEHWERLEKLDAQARRIARARREAEAPRSELRRRMLRAYYAAYRTTWAQCAAEAAAAGTGLRAWLYRGFWWNTVRQVPSTSAGLVIFELVRRKYGSEGDPVRINRDGYDILLR